MPQPGRSPTFSAQRDSALEKTMSVVGSIFWDFNLPNSTTWFYFSFLLAMALFFRFSRLLSMRNWDVVTLFLLVPGLLLLQDSRQPNPPPERNKAVRVAGIAGSVMSQGFVPASSGVAAVGQESAPLSLVPFEFWVKRTFAVLCHLAIVVALVMIGYLHFQDAAAGMAAATFYLMLPYTGIYVGQAHHVWPIVLLTWT